MYKIPRHFVYANEQNIEIESREAKEGWQVKPRR
jgi:hypothetical protein